jgi:hypothetical protein
VKAAEIAPAAARAQAMSPKRVASKFTHAQFRSAVSSSAGRRAVVIEIGNQGASMDDWDNFYMLAGESRAR